MAQRRPRTLVVIAAAVLLFSAGPAFAACTDPAGNPGEITYNTSHDVFQGCTANSGWVAFHAAGLPGGGGGGLPAEAAHWRLDETSGTTADDDAGTLNGTLSGFTAETGTVAGVVGTALDFDGVDDSIQWAPSGVVNLQTMTLSLWIRPDTVISTRNGIQFMANREGTTANSNYEFGIDGSANGTSNDRYLKLAYYNGWWRVLVSNYEVVPNTWQHVAVTIDTAANTYKFYANGLPAGSGSTAADLLTFPASTLFIGRGGDITANDIFDGRIDDVRIYNTALSDADILSIYSGN